MRDAGTRPPGWPSHLAGRLLSATLLTAALTVAAACNQAPRTVDASGANLLLITIDTLRTDRVGAFGDELAATPILDSLAREGVAFANAYAHAPLTLPSHSSLFTGRYPFTLQVRNNGSYFLRGDETTLAEELDKGGYSTAAFVSSYVLARKFGLDQGFDLYDDTIEAGDLLQSFTSETRADVVVDRFERWLDAEKPRQFFAWLHFYDPHLPYLPPEPFQSRFGDDPYRGEVAFVDAQIGRALEALARHSLRSGTLVVVTSDHGESFGEHGETGHGILTYEESLRVPLLMNGAGLPRGLEIDERVRIVDLHPTLLELLGAGKRDNSIEVVGRSLVPLITGSSPKHERRDVYFESLLGPEDYNWAPITGLISGDHKYISVPQPELYNLARDPEERSNLYRAQPGLATELDSALRRTLLGAGPADDTSRLELTAEDRSHLEALGYLGAGERSDVVIDPKQGIRIDGQIKEIRALVDAGRYDRADTLARDLAAEYPDLAMAGLYALRHEIFARQGKQHEAIEILRKATAALPGSERLRFLLANALLGAGRRDEAATIATRLLEENPRFSQARILLGQLAEAEGDYVGAVEEYGLALELEPRSLPLRRRRAEALLRTDDPASGIAALVEVARAGGFQNDPEQLYRTAVLSSQLGDQTAAEELFRIGLAVAPGGVHHVTFGLLLLQNGKPMEARTHLETALRTYSHDLNQQQRSVAAATLARLAPQPSE